MADCLGDSAHGGRVKERRGSTNDTEKVIPYFADPEAVLPDADTLERG